MLCDNCGKHEASIKLTQIINGKKTEMMICEQCGQKMGIADIGFEMPIDISNFLGDFEIENDSFMPFNTITKEVKCDRCNMTYQDFLDKEGWVEEENTNKKQDKLKINKKDGVNPSFLCVKLFAFLFC